MYYFYVKLYQILAETFTYMQESRYPKQRYFMLKRLDEVGRKTWASSVIELLFSYGFGYVWITHEVGDENNFLLQFKQRVMDGSFRC